MPGGAGLRLLLTFRTPNWCRYGARPSKNTFVLSMDEDCTSPDARQPAPSFIVKGNQQRSLWGGAQSHPLACVFSSGGVRAHAEPAEMPRCCLRGRQRLSRARQWGLRHLTGLHKPGPISEMKVVHVWSTQISGNAYKEGTILGDLGVLWTSPLCPTVLNSFLSSVRWISSSVSLPLIVPLFHKNRSFGSETFLPFSSLQPSDTLDRQIMQLWQDAHLVNVS